MLLSTYSINFGFIRPVLRKLIMKYFNSIKIMNKVYTLTFIIYFIASEIEIQTWACCQPYGIKIKNENFSFKIQSWYIRIEGKHWKPAELITKLHAKPRGYKVIWKFFKAHSCFYFFNYWTRVYYKFLYRQNHLASYNMPTRVNLPFEFSET